MTTTRAVPNNVYVSVGHMESPLGPEGGVKADAKVTGPKHPWESNRHRTVELDVYTKSGQSVTASYAYNTGGQTKVGGQPLKEESAGHYMLSFNCVDLGFAGPMVDQGFAIHVNNESVGYIKAKWS